MSLSLCLWQTHIHTERKTDREQELHYFPFYLPQNNKAKFESQESQPQTESKFEHHLPPGWLILKFCLWVQVCPASALS